MTKSGARESGSFDWRAWWDVNKWRYLTIQPVAGERTGDANSIGGSLVPDLSRVSTIAKLREMSIGPKNSLAREALGALASIGGTDTMTDIDAAAGGADAERRLAAFLAASRLRSGAGIDEMRLALRNPSRSALERGAAAVVLGIRRDSASLGALAGLANDARQPLEARVGSVIGLGVAGGDSVKVVADILGRDKEAHVLKLAAAFALGRSGDERAVPALTAALLDGVTADLRRAAAASLGAVSIHTEHVLAQAARAEASEALLYAATSDSDVAVRGLALISLAQAGGAGGHAECHRILAVGTGELVAPAMLALAIGGSFLEDHAILPFLTGNASYRAPAALALGLMRCDSAKGQLRSLFESTNDRSVKQFTALALGFLHDGVSAPSLVRFIVEAADRDSREAAVQALGLMGGYPAVVGLRGAADSAPSGEGRALALEMLGHVRDTQSRRRFEGVLASPTSSDEEKTAAIRALGFLGSPAGWLPPLREIFTDRDYATMSPLLKSLVASS
ncbi:MAG: HEAT repeat domain-containing protein [Planctomycetes bacterium]|nr:HEAT repeat domain-containing protein [Planctomycetota bacterium]MBI3846547.1 HEAT repeat domain-containing protein [Planctomycetota bacterium]